MFVDKVRVSENNTVNGRVYHSILVNPGYTNTRFVAECSSTGRGHEKHQNKIKMHGKYGVAGEDVFGHGDHSIYVSDGHGRNGLSAALTAIEMRHELTPTPWKIMANIKSAENELRQHVVRQLNAAHFEYSGATFAHMSFVKYKSRRWAVTVNVGDSEALLVYSNRIHVCSVAHNWDNLTLYRRYVSAVSAPRAVCYNRWNASKYKLRDKSGRFRPILNASWVSKLYLRKRNPKIKNGTQGVRASAAYENWGSCVLLYGRARGQNMASFGDNYERRHTRVPLDMVHVYIHEIPSKETVIGLVQSDGVSNALTLRECGRRAWAVQNARDYISDIKNPKDDMSVAMYVSRPKR